MKRLCCGRFSGDKKKTAGDDSAVRVLYTADGPPYDEAEGEAAAAEAEAGKAGMQVHSGEDEDAKASEAVNTSKRKLPQPSISKRSSATSQSSKHKSGPQEVKPAPVVPPLRIPLKLMMVIPDEDTFGDLLKKCAQKLGFDVRRTSKLNNAVDMYHNEFHDLVVVDCRNQQNIDYEALCSLYDRDEALVTTLLEIGFKRCLQDVGNGIVVMNELRQLVNSDIRCAALVSTQSVLYSCLEYCNDAVFITDQTNRIQFMNRSCEQTFGFKLNELSGKSLMSQFVDENEKGQAMSLLSRAKQWEGTAKLRTKSSTILTVQAHAIPVTCIGRYPTHHTFLMTVIQDGKWPRKGLDSRTASSEKPSLRMGSITMEDPHTRLISLLDAAKGSNSMPHVQAYIDKAKDIIKLSRAAEMSEQKTTALQPLPSESSLDRLMIEATPYDQIKVPIKLRALLLSSLQWDFDIFRLEQLTNKHPLVHLGMNIMLQFDVPNVLNVSERILQNWLTVVEMNYHVENCYHNSTHAADVMQSTAVFLDKERVRSIMDPIDEVTSLIAAAAHDIDHPGKSSAFLCNAKDRLAVLYNDVTVLESHHAALTFKLTLGDERINIFKNLDSDGYKMARYNVIDMILATEMTKHFEHLAKFVNVFCSKGSRENVDGDATDSDSIILNLPENITLIKRMMIKCADVSNPTRPLLTCIEWARRIAEEYFSQTDEEKRNNMPVVMPMFDRATCSIPKSQIGFVDYIINDMIEAWDDMPELLTYMRQNYIRWKEFDEQGLSTLHDIRQLQENLMSNKPQK